MKKTDLLILLLRSTLFDEHPNDSAKELIRGEAEWLLKVAKYHDIAHIIAYAFEKNGIVPEDKALAKALYQQRLVDTFRYEQTNYELDVLKKTLEDAKIPFVPLKGAIIKKYYPEPWMRTSGDIDILVKADQLKKASDCLESMFGYKVSGKPNYHDIALVSPTGVKLELHFSICENMKKCDSLLSKVWDYSHPVNDNGFEHTFNPEFFMFHIIAHTAYHFLMGGCGIRAVCDLYLLRKKFEYDKAGLDKLLKAAELDTFYHSLEELMEVWFENSSHTNLTLSLQNYIFCGGVYGTKHNRIAARRIGKGHISYIFERIFMPYEQLTVRYPELKGKVHLTPVYQVKRWIRIVSDKRLKHSVKELATSRTVSQNNIEKVSKLLNELKLDNL